MLGGEARSIELLFYACKFRCSCSNLCSELLVYKWMQSQRAAMTVGVEAGSEQKWQTCSSQNVYKKFHWRNLPMLADSSVMPLGLVKPYPCLNTALSSGYLC